MPGQNSGNRLYRRTVLIGGGGHCASVINAMTGTDLVPDGILDMPGHEDEKCCGVPYIGTDDMIGLLAPDNLFVITLGHVGNGTARQHKLSALVEQAGGEWATVVATDASVSPFATIGAGTVVLHHASVNAEAVIGHHVIINTAAIVEHNAIVGDFTHISTGAIVNGNARIGCDCFVGSGAIIKHGISICDSAVIGAGAVIINDITEPGVYAGIPGRKIK